MPTIAAALLCVATERRIPRAAIAASTAGTYVNVASVLPARIWPRVSERVRISIRIAVGFPAPFGPRKP